MKPHDVTIKLSTRLLVGLTKCHECGKLTEACNVIWVPHDDTIDRSAAINNSKTSPELVAKYDKMSVAPVLKFKVCIMLVPICEECNEIVWEDPDETT